MDGTGKNRWLTALGDVACWASAGYNTAGCAVIEQQLRTCMDAKKPPPMPKSNINYHLGRFQKRMTGTTKSS